MRPPYGSRNPHFPHGLVVADTSDPDTTAVVLSPLLLPHFGQAVTKW